MNKQRPENSVTEMKMNWMLVSERASQKRMQRKKCTTNTVKPTHVAAMESPECNYAYQSNKAFAMEQSHGHWPWPVWYLCHPVTLTNEMTDHNIGSQNERKVHECQKQMNQRVCKWDHSMVPELTSLDCPQHTSSSRKHQGMVQVMKRQWSCGSMKCHDNWAVTTRP
jgi:hypothetical protein